MEKFRHQSLRLRLNVAHFGAVDLIEAGRRLPHLSNDDKMRLKYFLIGVGMVGNAKQLSNTHISLLRPRFPLASSTQVTH